MNKLLNDALRAKGYAGPDIKMVLTDVTDPNGPYYTDTLTNTVVFDRKMLASLDRDKILNILGHEFGHYSKEDNKTGNQTIANYTGAKLEDRTKAMVAKEATEDTLAAIRNNPNVITGEEGKKLAESVPMERREYKIYQMSRPLDYSEAYNVYGSIDNSIVTSSKFIKKSKKEIEKQIGYDLDRISELAKDEITAIKNAVIIAGIIKRLSDYMEELENGGNKRSMWRSRSI